MTEEIKYPTYEELGQGIVESADIESMDIVIATTDLEESLELEEEDRLSSKLSERELRMITLENKLRTGEGFIAKMFGIEVQILPADIPEGPPISSGGTSGPDGGDFSGDREPRNPIDPSNVGALALPEPEQR